MWSKALLTLNTVTLLSEMSKTPSFVTQASIPSLEDLGKGQELGILKWLGSEAEETAQGGWAVHVAAPAMPPPKNRVISFSS